MILPSWMARALPAAIWLAGWLPFWRSHHSLPDALAALAAAALLVFAARRTWSDAPAQIAPGVLIGALVFAAAGVMTECTWPVAVALAALAGLGSSASARRLDELRLLALLSLPWLATDGASLALAFRHSAAWATGAVFHLLGFAIVRDGTTIDIEGQPLGVVAACAGLDTLHATLVAGAWLAGVLKGRWRFWIAVSLLPALAWFANTLRVIALGGVALAWGPEVAEGWFHNWGGLTVIVVMFALAGTWVRALHRTERTA